jgi:uncharacterized protein YutE (UPF0331/DUF86 family)
MDVKERVLLKLEEMGGYVNELQEMLPNDEEEYAGTIKDKRACEKTVELAIEAVISIVSIIVSQEKLGVPQSEDDLIDLLVKRKILSTSTGKKLKEMKGFRNILVHKYGEVDDKQAYAFLTEELNDFKLFANEGNTSVI